MDQASAGERRLTLLHLRTEPTNRIECMKTVPVGERLIDVLALGFPG
jgi:hypothetical protein